VLAASVVRRPAALIAIVLAATTWLAALALAPLVSASSSRVAATASAAVYLAGSFVCHQLPDRSFAYGGAQLPVCARCLGLYAGGLIGALIWAISTATRSTSSHFLQRATFRTALVSAALPTLLSVAAGALGIWDGSNLTRALLALPLGAVIAATVAAVAAGDLR